MINTISSPIRTTIYHLAASKTKPILIFIPGNPGFIEYYVNYLDLLHSSTGFEILGIAHAGFCTETPGSDKKIYTLDEQIQHKVDVMSDYITPGREIYIFGHSVGAWMVQRIIDLTSTKFDYKFIGFITPTILDIHKSQKGSMLLPIVTRISWLYKVVGVLSRVLSLLPDSVIKSVIDRVIDTEFEGAREITKHFVTHHEYVEQSIGLATEEMLTIQSDWEYHSTFFDKFEGIHKWIFFASPDHWVNDETRKDIEQSLENAKNVVIDTSEGIRHSFCVSQSKKFSEITKDAIQAYS